MSYPILYSATETDFSNNGIGILGDCISCEVTEEANGSFELVMRYPMCGIHYEDIADRSIIKAKADQFRDPQLFRVYATSKPMSGIVTVSAEHISYDLSGIPVSPFSAGSVTSALSGLGSNAVADCPFSFWTDKTTASVFRVITPASIRSCLGGSTGSILDLYGGEFEFDNYAVKLHNNRGMNRGVSIRYGKNLTDIQQEQNCSNVATGVYPYWVDMEGQNLVELPEKIVQTPGTYNFVKIKTLDLSQSFETQPTEDQLRAKAESYINANNVGVPIVSLTVSFSQLEQTEEYKSLKLLERVSLFDTVNVEFPTLGVSATAKAVKLVYDALADRVKSITLGSVKANIADTIVEQQQEIQKAPTKTDLERAKEAATAWLTNGKGYAYFRKDDLGNIVDILFMDTQDPSTAVNVMRVGQSGIGFSHDGVNGPYESAWTIDGNFVADFITAGTISGIKIIGTEGIIGGLTMSANSLTATYRHDYPTFTSDDITKAQAYIVGAGTLTDEELEKYDVNMDGRITSLDTLAMQKMIAGMESTYSVYQFTIDASKPKACITVEITEGYRAGQKTVLGVGSLSARDVAASETLAIKGFEVADFVVDCRASDVWSWWKWNSGVAECWGKINLGTVNITTAWGALYESPAFTQEFPSGLFVDAPDFLSIEFLGSGSGAAMIERGTGLSATNAGTFYLVKATSQTGMTNATVGFHAIGRWK